MRKILTLAAATLALAAALTVGRSTADAATANTLTITQMDCWDVGGGGLYYNETQCYAETSGGAGGNVYDWDVIVNYQEDTANSSYIEGVCTDSYPVTLTVTDASGATTSRFEEFVCYATSDGGGIEP